jgi:membrane protease YdiL (CAAX protease family)
LSEQPSRRADAASGGRRHGTAPRLVFAHLALTFLLAWAVWIPGSLLLGDPDHPRLSALPWAFVFLQGLGATAPTVAAYVLLRATGRRDVIRWIAGRYKVWRVHPGWYLVAALLAPAITVLSLVIRALTDPGFHVPATSPLGEMQRDIGITGIVLTFPLLILGQLPSSPLFEEFGWRGYVLPSLQSRWSALTSSVFLGVVWGLWHLPLIVAYGDSLAPYLALIVAHSVLIAWIVNSTGGSMLLAMLFHAGLNTALPTLSTGATSPVELALTWLMTAVVIMRCGPRNLASARISLPVAEEPPCGRGHRGKPHEAKMSADR